MIFFLYGADSFRSRQKMNEIKDKFRREVDAGGASLSVLDGETLTITKFGEAFGSPSLFARKRMIIVKNLFTNKSATIFNAVLDRLKSKDSADVILVFWEESDLGSAKKDKAGLADFLKKEKYAAEFKPFSNREMAAWIKKKAEEMKLAVSMENAGHLAYLLGNDLWLINNELEKIISYKLGQRLNLSDEGGVIEKKDIETLVKGVFDDNIFALTDAISAKNRPLAMQLLEDQISLGLGEFYVLNMIIRQFKILIKIRQLIDLGENARKIGNELKLHPFIIQKGMGQAKNFSLDFLKNTLASLVRSDYLAKTGQQSIKNSLSVIFAGL